MKFDGAQITKLARDTGFPADNLEKVLRVRELLTELHKHPFLQGKLVLKGGTALNLSYLDLARISVDIDLNYIAHIDQRIQMSGEFHLEPSTVKSYRDSGNFTARASRLPQSVRVTSMQSTPRVF